MSSLLVPSLPLPPLSSHASVVKKKKIPVPTKKSEPKPVKPVAAVSNKAKNNRESVGARQLDVYVAFCHPACPSHLFYLVHRQPDFYSRAHPIGFVSIIQRITEMGFHFIRICRFMGKGESLSQLSLKKFYYAAPDITTSADMGDTGYQFTQFPHDELKKGRTLVLTPSQVNTLLDESTQPRLPISNSPPERAEQLTTFLWTLAKAINADGMIKATEVTIDISAPGSPLAQDGSAVYSGVMDLALLRQLPVTRSILEPDTPLLKNSRAETPLFRLLSVGVDAQSRRVEINKNMKKEEVEDVDSDLEEEEEEEDSEEEEEEDEEDDTVKRTQASSSSDSSEYDTDAEEEEEDEEDAASESASESSAAVAISPVVPRSTAAAAHTTPVTMEIDEPAAVTQVAATQNKKVEKQQQQQQQEEVVQLIPVCQSLTAPASLPLAVSTYPHMLPVPLLPPSCSPLPRDPMFRYEGMRTGLFIPYPGMFAEIPLDLRPQLQQLDAHRREAKRKLIIEQAETEEEAHNEAHIEEQKQQPQQKKQKYE